MDLFIGNISERTSVNDLISFFKGFEKRATFRIEQKKLEDGTLCRYGIASFHEEKTALKAIKKLEGKTIHGKTPFLREFIHRSYSNERRALNWRTKPWEGVERRDGERRRKERVNRLDTFDEILASSPKEETPDPETIQVTGYQNFARKG